MALISKLTFWVRRLASRYPHNQLALAICQFMREPLTTSAEISMGTVAVECIEDPYYLALFAILCRELIENAPVDVDLVVPRSIGGAVGKSWRHKLVRSWLVAAFVNRQWIRAYRAAIGPVRVGYSSVSLDCLFNDALDWVRSYWAWRRWRTAPNKDISIFGVPAADLIVDSFLRFAPAPSFSIRDPLVRQIIWQVHRDVRRARQYFRIRRPIIYLTPYSTYIEHGIPVRVALQEGVSVRSFGNLIEFGKNLTQSDSFHTPNSSSYRAAFNTLENKDLKLQEAERALRARLSGGVDLATSYMKSSAYAVAGDELPDVSGAVVVFMHDFYDSPHVYGDLVFRDFWEWVCFTIEALEKSNQEVWLKSHPNQISLGSSVLKDLKKKYPESKWLPPQANNAALAKAGMICGITVYGTVAHELAYLGIPSIACARHPHHAFEFCRTAHSTDQYKQFLATPAELPVSKSEMRRQALEFYYMHNLHGDARVLDIRRRCAALWKACNIDEYNESALQTCLTGLKNSHGLKAIVGHWLKMGASLEEPRRRAS